MIDTVSHRFAVLFAACLPPVGVMAPKGSVVLLLALGLVGAVRWVQEGRPRLPVDRRIAFALAALALWAAATATWAFAPAGALVLVLKLMGVSAAGVAALSVVARLDVGQRRTVENALFAGMGLGIAALAVGFAYATVTGEALWSTFKSDPLATLNTGAVAMGLLAWPAFAALWRRGHRLPAGIGATVLYAGLWFLSSAAALLAPVVGVTGFFVVWFLGRRGALALAAVVAVLAVAAPQIASWGLSPEKIGTPPPPSLSSVEHRIRIWAFTTEKIDEKPVLGWGMDASRAVPGGHQELAPGTEILPLHPHNAFLQVRLELGLPGAAIIAALLGVFFAVVVGGMNDRLGRAVAAGTGVAFLTVASISYGIWQNWWIAFAWSLAALTALTVGPSAPAGGREAASGP
ncbi:MAG: O-antigen ligase family protein [Rhodospirillales bacterium]